MQAIDAMAQKLSLWSISKPLGLGYLLWRQGGSTR